MKVIITQRRGESYTYPDVVTLKVDSFEQLQKTIDCIVDNNKDAVVDVTAKITLPTYEEDEDGDNA